MSYNITGANGDSANSVDNYLQSGASSGDKEKAIDQFKQALEDDSKKTGHSHGNEEAELDKEKSKLQSGGSINNDDKSAERSAATADSNGPSKEELDLISGGAGLGSLG